MQKWEYHFVEIEHNDLAPTDLQSYGREGWELVSAAYREDICSYGLFFKRPVG